MEPVTSRLLFFTIVITLSVMLLSATGCEGEDGGPAITSPHFFLNNTDEPLHIYFLDTLLTFGEQVIVNSESIEIAGGEKVELGTFLSPPPGFIGNAISRFPSDYRYSYIVRPGIDTMAYEQSEPFSTCSQTNNPLCVDNYLLVEERIDKDEETRIFLLSFE